MGTLWNREPALFAAVINAAVALGIGFGLHVTVDQFALIMTFVNAVLALLVRSKVTPV